MKLISPSQYPCMECPLQLLDFLIGDLAEEDCCWKASVISIKQSFWKEKSMLVVLLNVLDCSLVCIKLYYDEEYK